LAPHAETLPSLPARQEIQSKELELGEFESRRRNQAAESVLMSWLPVLVLAKGLHTA